jgi:thiol-disulfide isomerase/thioredoxin
MKKHLVPSILAILATSSIHAAEEPKAPAAPTEKKATAEAVDFSQFKSPEEFWAYVKKVSAETPPKANSREEFIEALRSWLERQRTAAEAFLKKYPDDVRRWDAKVVVLLTASQLQRFGGAPADPAASQKEVEAILAAPEASPEAKSEASYLLVQLRAQNADTDKPETLQPLQNAVTDFLDGYPESKRAPEIAAMQMQLLPFTNPANATAILQKLAASKNEKVAQLAKAEIAKVERMATLKTKPLELKFTATDGKEVDVEKLRGKVVLIDFWASWCGPCIAEMPNVVSTYKKLHDKGFEIVGISLDQDKAAMETALKKHGMEWAQYFDGQGWQNKISQSFGIDSIPAAWLLDKKGLLRETGLRGDALATGVEKLLAE